MTEDTFTLDISSIGGDAQDRLKQLTHKPNGYMAMTLDCCILSDEDFFCKVVIHMLESDEIVGWAIVQDLLVRYTNGHADLSIYVNPKYRGRGIGSKIMSKVKSECKERRVNMWVDDDKAAGLYRKFVSDDFHALDCNSYNHYRIYND